jgi:hypothetical protein
VDPVNRYCTKRTYWALRSEYFFGLVVSIALFAMHVPDGIDWVAAVLLFAYPDTIGYLPGAIAYRRAKDHRVPLWYARTYNVLHSPWTAGAVGGLYALIHGPDWALMAIPIHLFGDRSIFGNIYKMPQVHFEPDVPHPAWATVMEDVERPWWEFDESPPQAAGAERSSAAAAPSEPVGAR